MSSAQRSLSSFPLSLLLNAHTYTWHTVCAFQSSWPASPKLSRRLSCGGEGGLPSYIPGICIRQHILKNLLLGSDCFSFLADWLYATFTPQHPNVQALPLPEPHILQLGGEFCHFYGKRIALCHSPGSHTVPVKAPHSPPASLWDGAFPRCTTKVSSAFMRTWETSQELSSVPLGVGLCSGPWLKTAVPLEPARLRKSPETF